MVDAVALHLESQCWPRDVSTKGGTARLGSVGEGGPMRLADEYTYGGLVVVLPLILVVKMVLF